MLKTSLITCQIGVKVLKHDSKLTKEQSSPEMSIIPLPIDDYVIEETIYLTLDRSGGINSLELSLTRIRSERKIFTLSPL